MSEFLTIVIAVAMGIGLYKLICRVAEEEEILTSSTKKPERRRQTTMEENDYWFNTMSHGRKRLFEVRIQGEQGTVVVSDVHHKPEIKEGCIIVDGVEYDLVEPYTIEIKTVVR